MKHLIAQCTLVLLCVSATTLHARNSDLSKALDYVISSPTLDESEKEFIASLPEFFTLVCVKQLYFDDQEYRSLKPFVNTSAHNLEAFISIKEKLAVLHGQAVTDTEKNSVNFVRYLIDLALECLSPDSSPLNSLTTRGSDAAAIANACRLLILEVLCVVNSISANINAPCM